MSLFWPYSTPPRGPMPAIIGAAVLGFAFFGARYGWQYGQRLAAKS